MAEPSAVETQIAALEEKCAEQAKALTALHSLFCELELVAGNNVEAYHKLKVELEEKTQSEVSHLERSQQQQQSDAAAAEEQLRNAVDNEKTDAESKLKAMREAMGEQERELTRLQQLLETQKAEHEKKLAEAMQQQAQSAQDEAAAKASHASLEEASVSAAAAAASRQKEQVEVLKLLRQLMDPAHNNSILAMSNTLEKTVEARAKVMAGRLEQSIGEAKRIAADVTVRAAELQKQAKSNQDHSAAAAQELQSQLAQEQKRIKVLEAKLLGAQAKVDAAENRARAADAARTKHSKDFEVKLAEKTKGLEAQLQAERKKCQTLAGRQQKSLSRQKEMVQKHSVETQRLVAQISHARDAETSLQQQLKALHAQKATDDAKLRRALSRIDSPLTSPSTNRKKVQAVRRRRSSSKGSTAMDDNGDGEGKGSGWLKPFTARFLSFLAGAIIAWFVAKAFR